MDSHYVEIVERESDEVVKRMGPHSEKHANRIRNGAARNLDHEAYYVRIVEEGDE